MRRDLAFRGPARQAWRPASSIACLAFVALLALAFWAGVVWIAQTFMALSSQGF